MAQNIKFIFDLDGTLTRVETLPVIAQHFNVEAEISELTKLTIRGEIPFAESFTKRVDILGKFKVSEVDRLLGAIPMFGAVLEFIQAHKTDCCVATGNLDVWTGTLLGRVGCRVHSSTAQVSNDQVTGIHSLLRKVDVVTKLQSRGHRVVYIGDGDNDAEAMSMADVSIASGLVHAPAPSLLKVADDVVWDEADLITLLRQLSRAKVQKS